MNALENPPAFPVESFGLTYSGMTLRDYFAAAALQGFMANKSRATTFLPADDAHYCYGIADAMLKERSK